MIVFNALPNGLHNNCTITVTDAAGNVSNQLNISPFTVQGAVTTTATQTSTADALQAQLQGLQSKLAELQAQQSGNIAGSYKFLSPLSVGSTGTAVTELQKRLIAEGIYAGPVTGRYGSLTKAAVKKYQARYGLPQLGIIGPATRALLNK